MGYKIRWKRPPHKQPFSSSASYVIQLSFHCLDSPLTFWSQYVVRTVSLRFKYHQIQELPGSPLVIVQPVTAERHKEVVYNDIHQASMATIIFIQTFLALPTTSPPPPLVTSNPIPPAKTSEKTSYKSHPPIPLPSSRRGHQRSSSNARQFRTATFFTSLSFICTGCSL